jgi:hypothetical protein
MATSNSLNVREVFWAFIVAIASLIWTHVANAAIAQQWLSPVISNRCIGNYRVMYLTTSVNDRQCAFTVATYAPLANAITYYMANGTCIAHQVATFAGSLCSVGVVDSSQQICIFYTTDVSE